MPYPHLPHPSCPRQKKIPKAMAEKFSAVTTLTDAFCAKHLNDEYQQLIQPKND